MCWLFWQTKPLRTLLERRILLFTYRYRALYAKNVKNTSSTKFDKSAFIDFSVSVVYAAVSGISFVCHPLLANSQLISTFLFRFCSLSNINLQDRLQKWPSTVLAATQWKGWTVHLTVLLHTSCVLITCVCLCTWCVTVYLTVREEETSWAVMTHTTPVLDTTGYIDNSF